MRVLLDECVPRALREELLGHEVMTVAEVGWAGVKNGELVLLAARRFDLLLTVDRNLEYQQNFANLALAVIVVNAPSNDVVVLRPLMPAVLAGPLTRRSTTRPQRPMRGRARATKSARSLFSKGLRPGPSKISCGRWSPRQFNTRPSRRVVRRSVAVNASRASEIHFDA
jgi:hypothetical protein